MKVTAHRPVAAAKPVEKPTTNAQVVRSIGHYVNNQIANNDVGIDQSETAGTDITNQTPPRGTAPKAAELFLKFQKAYDPRTAQQEGAALYAFNLKDIDSKHPDKPLWGVAKWDENGGFMVLFDRKGEIGRGKLDDNQLYRWAARKQA
jgi:hypothetical protein